MKTYVEPSRRIPIYAEVDVVVIGGGSAGAAAAIAAARHGADTLLIEQQGFLGGRVTASLLGVISGFRNPKLPAASNTVRGIAAEVIAELRKMDGLGRSPCEQQDFDPASGQLNYSYAVDTEKLKLLLIRMAEQAQCDFLLHTFAACPIVAADRVQGVMIENKSGRQAIFARVVVDCTDNADVAFRAGAVCHSDLPDDSFSRKPQLMYKLAGNMPDDLRFPGVMTKGTMLVSGPLATISGASASDISRAEIETRTQVLDHLDELKRSNPALQFAYLVETPPCLALRRTRYIQGQYMLTEQDALSGARFSDAVAISSSPIAHQCGAEVFLEHEGFDVPYRCLVPNNLNGLLVAGRGISSQHSPYESLRAPACAMAIGQAAGVAAAIAADKNLSPRQIEVADVRQTLIQQGARLFD